MTQNSSTVYKGLKAILGSKRVEWTLPAQFKPERTTSAVLNIKNTHGILFQKTPGKFDLEQIHSRIKHTIKYGEDLSTLSTRDLRRSPWVLFFPANDSNNWLAKNQSFTNQYILWLKQRGQYKSVAALLKVFIKHYPSDMPTFDSWRSVLKELISDKSTSRIARLKKCCDFAGYLHLNGPEIFAEKLFKDETPIQAIEKAGVSGEILQSVFFKSSIKNYIKLVSQNIDNPALDLKRLKLHLSILENDDGRMIHAEMARELANQLLSPFISKNPSKATEDIIRMFLLKHLNDPRFYGNNWYGVNKEIRDVMHRWLISLTLEDFFKLLDKTAEKGHWLYRRAFWSAYLNKGVITDAWIALGKSASDLIKTKDHRLRYGNIVRGERKKSSIILKIRGMTIVEISHVGKCRIYLDSNKNTPELYKSEYKFHDLVPSTFNDNSNYGVAHGGSENGSWQLKIAEIIRKHTGISMNSKDYMPRRT